jgi:hypothetical protein
MAAAYVGDLALTWFACHVRVVAAGALVCSDSGTMASIRSPHVLQGGTLPANWDRSEGEFWPSDHLGVVNGC